MLASPPPIAAVSLESFAGISWSLHPAACCLSLLFSVCRVLPRFASPLSCLAGDGVPSRVSLSLGLSPRSISVSLCRHGRGLRAVVISLCLWNAAGCYGASD